MSNGTEDFDKLCKLLKLKRHEEPPPGYFSRFSGLVVNRIEREGDAGGSVFAEVPWLRKLFGLFEASPMVAGLLGSAVCALAIFGIAAANQTDKAPSAFAPGAGTHSSLASASVPEGSGRSTDAMFSSNVLGVGFGGDSTSARLETVSFTSSHP